jgi:GNAT superfamily N-acetyltransferase
MTSVDITTFRPGDETEVRHVHCIAFADCLRDHGPLYGWQEPTVGEVSAWHEPPLREVWVARDPRSEAVIGYARAHREPNADGRGWRLWLEEPVDGLSQSGLAVDPTWQNNGIGRQIVATLLRRYRMAHTTHVIGVAYSDNPAATALARALGFDHGTEQAHDSVLATYDLHRALPDVPDVPGVVIRCIESRDVQPMRAVFGEARRSVYGASPTEEQIQSWIGSGWGETILVAECDGRVVGCMEHTKLGRIGIPGVLTAYRGRGIGSLLMRDLLAAMRDKGLALALSDTGYTPEAMDAVYLYRRLGFDTSREVYAWARTCASLP